mmetsp:Transcript_11818/g.26819  ORF Transcript_11818/g.26819 Transcript_11818/m.26819 type:complete len:276 (-) Transcript_11818:42-869(-)
MPATIRHAFCRHLAAALQTPAWHARGLGVTRNAHGCTATLRMPQHVFREAAVPCGVQRLSAPSVALFSWPATTAAAAAVGSRRFSTRSLHGRLFYKRRPRFVPVTKGNTRRKWLEGRGTTKGICTKVYIAKARKPNSGNRKVAYVRLKNDRVVKCYIPGIGHNLQVHSVVMVKGGRHKDVIGCNYTLVRGAYDLLPVKGRGTRRSKYGAPKPNREPKRKRFQHLMTQRDRRLYFYKTGVEIPAEKDMKQLREPRQIIRSNPPPTYMHKNRKRKQK